MKAFLIAVLALVFASTAQAASINSKCAPGMTVSEFVQLNIDTMAKHGQKLEMVEMTGSALDKFKKVLQDYSVSQGYAPTRFDLDWDLIIWAAFKGPNNEKLVGIAAFKDGCLKEADVWKEEVFFKHMKAAFGVDT